MIPHWKTGVIIGVFLFLLGLGGAIEHADPAPLPHAHVVCQEDEWCWNAFIDGNHWGHYLIGP